MKNTSPRARRARLWAIGAAVVSLALVLAGSFIWYQAAQPLESEPPIPVSDSTVEWADATFGTFEASTYSSVGDERIDFPEDLAGVTAMLVSVTFEGSGPFRMSELYGVDGGAKAHHSRIGDVGEGPLQARRFVEPRTGDWSHSGLELSGDGEWTVSFLPISAAGSLAAPTAGRGEDVLIYEGDATSFEFSHHDTGGFWVALGAWEGPADQGDFGWVNSTEIPLVGKGRSSESFQMPNGPVLVSISGEDWRLAPATS